MPIERQRIRNLNTAAPRIEAAYVLYWCQVNRRVESNHAFAYAVGLANENGLPVLVYEGLTCTYPAANDRLHTFVLEAVPQRSKAWKQLGAGHCFYLRARAGDPDDVVYKLAARARCIVTDDFPAFIPALYNSRVPAKIGSRTSPSIPVVSCR
jgi:deoxyribodipyrimidine photo-lyase